MCWRRNEAVQEAPTHDLPLRLLLSAPRPRTHPADGGFAEWAVVEAKHVFPVPEARPEMVALLTSGLTASIALDQAGLVSWADAAGRAAAGCRCGRLCCGAVPLCAQPRLQGGRACG